MQLCAEIPDLLEAAGKIKMSRGRITVKYTVPGLSGNWLCRQVLFIIITASFALHAGQPPEIENYTLSRQKSPAQLSSDSLHSITISVEVTERNGIYRINAVAILQAAAEHVRYVLTDYRHIYRLNPSIIESNVVHNHDDGSVSVMTKVLGCAAYFCEELSRVEKVRVLPDGDLQADIVPELSDYKSGTTLWQIKGEGEKCEVIYSSEFEPDVFIPPVVGKFLIKNSIKKELQVSFDNLEKISRFIAANKRRINIQPAYNTVHGNVESSMKEISILSGTASAANE